MRLEDFSSPTQQKNLSSSPQKARVLHIFHRLWGQFSVHVYLPSCLAVSSWTKHKSPQLQRCFWNFWDAQTLTNLKFRWSLVRCIFWLNNRCSIWFQSLCWMKHPKLKELVDESLMRVCGMYAQEGTRECFSHHPEGFLAFFLPTCSSWWQSEGHSSQSKSLCHHGWFEGFSWFYYPVPIARLLFLPFTFCKWGMRCWLFGNCRGHPKYWFLGTHFSKNNIKQATPLIFLFPKNQNTQFFKWPFFTFTLL